MSTTTLALLSPAVGAGASAVSSNRPSTCMFASHPPSSSSACTTALARRSRRIRCEVALKPSDSEASTSPSSEEEEEEDEYSSKVGAKVKVKVPLKVYHVPRFPEVDLTGMEGVLKQYVAVWKGKRISANLPFRVEFVKEIEGRGPVKFFAHLKEDEIEFI